MDDFSFNHAEVDLGALKSNYKRISNYAGGTPMICVVKADAYGHGAKQCTLALHDAGCRFFAVSSANEALEIRPLVTDSEILILGIALPNAASALCNGNIICALASIEQARLLKMHIPAGKRLRVHIKLNTGMNRIGFSCDEKGVAEIAEALSFGCFEPHGLFSHLACADMPGVMDDFTDAQLKRYLYVKDALQARGIEFACHHISNSAATILRPEMRMDAVRCGIILYGPAPSCDVATDGLAPVMTLKSRVSHIHTLKKGECVGYGATFCADREMTVATVPIGYGDGFIRAYNKTPGVLINGELSPILGRICMDQFMADVTGKNVSIGDEVELFGKNNPIELFSDAAGTISYETLCIVGRRVPRVYIG